MILVYADHDRGELDPLALQVVSAARGLDADVHALIVGPNAEKCVDDLRAAERTAEELRARAEASAIAVAAAYSTTSAPTVGSRVNSHSPESFAPSPAEQSPFSGSVRRVGATL